MLLRALSVQNHSLAVLFWSAWNIHLPFPFFWKIEPSNRPGHHQGKN